MKSKIASLGSTLRLAVHHDGPSSLSAIVTHCILVRKQTVVSLKSQVFQQLGGKPFRLFSDFNYASFQQLEAKKKKKPTR